MYRLIIICFISFTVLFPWGNIFGQTPATDWENLIKVYSNTQSVYAEIRLLTYADHNRNQLLEDYKTKYIKNGNKIYTNSMGIETLKNEQYYIYVDHNTQILLMQKNSNNSKNENLLDGFLGSELYGDESKFQKRITDKGDIILRVNVNDDNFEYYEICYEPVSYKLKEIVIAYSLENSEDNEDNMVLLVIQYEKLMLNEKIKEDILSQNQFVYKENEKWVPVEKYKDYEFIGR